MALLACRDHAERIKVLEDQVARLIEVMSGINNLSGEIIAKLDERSLHREPDLTLEAYHR